MVNTCIRHLMQGVTSLFLVLLLAGPIFAHHGPEWIELQSFNDIKTIALDTDNDGLFDNSETLLKTNPDKADTDDDGYSDLFENNYRAFGFDPLVRNTDSDQDGLTDDFEAEIGTSSELQDTDEDTYSDFDEVMNRRFGFHPKRPSRDSDFDGLTDRMEKKLRTSPTSPDSNNDGVSDFQAFYEGVNPRQKFVDGEFGEIIGSTISIQMQEVLLKMRNGGPFPEELAAQLPYPAITRGLYGPIRDPRDIADLSTLLSIKAEQEISPSSALIQSGMSANLDQITATALYPTYNEIVTQLKDIALDNDGSSNAHILRIFYWSEPTEGHRWIYSVKISDNPDINEREREMLFMGLHHGRELVTASYTMELIRKLTNGYQAGDQAMVRRVNGSEIWVIPVVNPDGYAMARSEFGLGADVNWRKNIRKVLELNPGGSMQAENARGVDPNRNYDFTHIRTLSFPQRQALGTKSCEANGLTGFGPNIGPCEGFLTNSSTYAGFAFSDVESRSVRMLADNIFQSGNEIDSLRCSLSWHTGGKGAILAPFNHDSIVNISLEDQNKMAQLGNAYAAATGYFYFFDSWWSVPGNYQALGTSDDWFYSHNKIIPLTVEAHAPVLSGSIFFPGTFADKKVSVDRNMDGAVAFMNVCSPLRALPSPAP